MSTWKGAADIVPAGISSTGGTAMGTYADLQGADKEIFDNTVNQIRVMAAQIFKAFDTMDQIAADQNAISLFVSVNAGETVPNTSAYPEADNVTRSEIKAIWDMLVALKDDPTNGFTADNRAAVLKFCGLNSQL